MGVSAAVKPHEQERYPRIVIAVQLFKRQFKTAGK